MREDPVTLQLISNSLVEASEEMGIALRNSAYSPNIRERMDHSAAIFDSDGHLLAQAEHIPVHLGSLPWGLRNLLDRLEKERTELPDDSMMVSNNPYITGTHLNDVTVISPIYWKSELVAYAANKAHHSDVGGAVPGSISMESETLLDEGVVLEPRFLVKDGRFLASTLRLLSSASRTPIERLGDLKAQRAANVTGARRVMETISKYGLPAFKSAGKDSYRHSEKMMKTRLRQLKRGVYVASDCLEGRGGEELVMKVKVSVSETGVQVDYAGTCAQVDYPLNAVFGVTISGAFFVIRSVTGDDIPANHGAFSLIQVSAPSGSLVNPTYPHPVGGGNVETSQRNADLLFRALADCIPHRVPSACGGSMNNVMMGGGKGRSRWAFYETIGVGLGARMGADGIDGIQGNMTNTMNTPIEEIERTFPLMVTRYQFRGNSGGEGRWKGGLGLVRRYRMLGDSTTLTIMSDREHHAPWGLVGGLPGQKTEASVKNAKGERRVPTKSTLTLRRGDEFEIRTAGGGGYGSAESDYSPSG